MHKADESSSSSSPTDALEASYMACNPKASPSNISLAERRDVLTKNARFGWGGWLTSTLRKEAQPEEPIDWEDVTSPYPALETHEAISSSTVVAAMDTKLLLVLVVWVLVAAVVELVTFRDDDNDDDDKVKV